MPTPLIPQEIYVLERYSSEDYYLHMQDAWEVMLKHVESCLQRFIRQLPPDYRTRPLPYQPDIVWGQTVLPIFRETMQSLNEGFIELTHGIHSGLGAAISVENDLRGAREYSEEWMDEVEPGAAHQYWELIGRASFFAGNIMRTSEAMWCKGALSTRYNPSTRGPLDPPTAWPRYRSNPRVQVRTGEPILQTGIYLPEVEDASPQFLIASGKHSKYQRTAPMAKCGLIPSGLNAATKQPTLWTLVERVPGETVPLEEGKGPSALPPPPTYAGQPCPRTGYWYTRAQRDSRRRFEQDEVFPSIPSEVSKGYTLWHWDTDQSGH
ncbi:hypothetical protein [Stutzerimonas stutzeri]|uniref:Uncharacterized protein n=1 Tax=Stutzerimonas stutzeri TaxID=316 RepID=A0A6I6LR16_STUST|nr:hypothetical protein [Stutzerimonas stutzeri]QGZ30925.1 hypothetical protein GQA94_12940 [Stutzerimonas stutzeri]